MLQADRQEKQTSKGEVTAKAVRLLAYFGAVCSICQFFLAIARYAVEVVASAGLTVLLWCSAGTGRGAGQGGGGGRRSVAGGTREEQQGAPSLPAGGDPSGAAAAVSREPAASQQQQRHQQAGKQQQSAYRDG